MFAGDATSSPVGSASEKLRADALSVELLLSTVKSKVADCPAVMIVGEKLVPNVGGGLAVNVALALPPLPRLEVKLPVTLSNVSAMVATTDTLMVQADRAGTVPPL